MDTYNLFFPHSDWRLQQAATKTMRVLLIFSERKNVQVVSGSLSTWWYHVFSSTLYRCWHVTSDFFAVYIATGVFKDILLLCVPNSKSYWYFKISNKILILLYSFLTFTEEARDRNRYMFSLWSRAVDEETSLAGVTVASYYQEHTSDIVAEAKSSLTGGKSFLYGFYLWL